MIDIYFAGEPSDGLGFYALTDDGEPSNYYPTKAALRAALADGTAWGPEPFALAVEPATRPRRATFESQSARQSVLFTGLDCLPGQENLFES